MRVFYERCIFGFNAEQIFFAAQWKVLQFAMVAEMTLVWRQMAKSTMYDKRGRMGGQREQKVQSEEEERPNVL